MSALARHIGTGLIAVALLLSGLAHADNPPVAIDDAGPIETSFPGFAGFMNGLGARIADEDAP